MPKSVTAIQSRIDAAVARRRSLVNSGVTEALRLVHGEADGIPGLVVERFGPVLIVQLHEGRLTVAADALRPVIADLQVRLGTMAVYVKRFVRDRAEESAEDRAAHRDPTPWIGEPSPTEFAVRENGMAFLIRPYDGFSTELFLEHRDNRARIRRMAAGRRVLNLFCYTCGFSVAAVAGGAAQVTSVDLSKRYLEWGRRNFAANGLSEAGQLFFCNDTFEFYKRAARQGWRYDLIIVDPPTFARARRPARIFVLEDRLDELLAGAACLLHPGGAILFATNHRELSYRRIESSLAAATGGRRFRVIERPELPIDFAGDPDYSRTVIARFD